jgi:hypothetical protein
MILFCIRYFLLFLFSSICYAVVTESEALILNDYFDKDLSVAEWNTDLTLRLTKLPDTVFPEEFKNIPKLTCVNLIHTELSHNCIDTNLREKEIDSKIKNFLELKKENLESEPVILCLDGQEYSLYGKLGAGCEGDVYSIRQNSTGKTFALKIYNRRKKIKGDLLVLERARCSLSHLAMPLLVNLSQSYTVFPLLGKMSNFVLDKHMQQSKVSEFEKESLKPSLEKDGLMIGDSKPDNCMVDPDNQNLLRIDFGSLKIKN